MAGQNGKRRGTSSPPHLICTRRWKSSVAIASDVQITSARSVFTARHSARHEVRRNEPNILYCKGSRGAVLFVCGRDNIHSSCVHYGFGDIRLDIMRGG